MEETNSAQYENFDFSDTFESISSSPPPYENITISEYNSGGVTNGCHENKTASNNSSPMSSRSNTRNDNDGTTTSDAANVPILPEKENNSDYGNLQLEGGLDLLGESRTETARANLYTVKNDNHSSAAPGRQPFNMASALISLSNGTGTAKARAAKSLYSSPPSDSIPEEEIEIPNSCNISSFTCTQLANFLRCFNVEKRIIAHLYRKNVDGKRFSRLRDSELEDLGMKNPAIVFFRDKSSAKAAKKKPFFVL